MLVRARMQWRSNIGKAFVEVERLSGKKNSGKLWYEALPKKHSWSELWSAYVRCACGGIRTLEAQCPVCGENAPNPDWVVVRDSGGTELGVVPSITYMGAEGQFEDIVYLQMLEREWLKPVEPDLYSSISESHRPSVRAIIVLVFWTYFETRIERLFRQTARGIPEQVMAHLLERYSGIGDRQDRLYKVVFSTTYRADLSDLGYGNVAALLKKVEGCRNKFMHGEPEAIDDLLVQELVAGLQQEHQGWIAVFNRRLKEAREGKT